VFTSAGLRESDDTPASAQGRRRAALLAVALLAVGGLALGAAVAGPADAASASVSSGKPDKPPGGGGGGGKPGGGGGGGTTELVYTAVGDSFAAGTGAGSYLVGSPCYRSSKSYPSLLDADANLRLDGFLACSGASTVEVRDLQVPSIPTTATRVTLTVGGNDTGFATVMQNCFAILTSTCQADIAAGVAIAESQGFKDSVAATVAAIKARAPGAKIVVTGYPLLFHEPNAKYQWADEVNAATPTLNAAIKATAEANGAVFVDVTGAFAGHGIGSSSAWINDFSLWRYLGGSPDAFHPNATGYTAYAAEIRKVIG
jgi:lysophospholipase L1-like esterase